MQFDEWLHYSWVSDNDNSQKYLIEGAPFRGNRISLNIGFSKAFFAAKGIESEEFITLADEYKTLIRGAGGKWMENENFKAYAKGEKRGWHVADNHEILAKLLALRCPRMERRVWRPIDLTDGETDRVENILKDFKKAQKSRLMRKPPTRTSDKKKHTARITKGASMREMEKLQLGGEIFKKLSKNKSPVSQR